MDRLASAVPFIGHTMPSAKQITPVATYLGRSSSERRKCDLTASADITTSYLQKPRCRSKSFVDGTCTRLNIGVPASAQGYAACLWRTCADRIGGPLLARRLPYRSARRTRSKPNPPAGRG